MSTCPATVRKWRFLFVVLVSISALATYYQYTLYISSLPIPYRQIKCKCLKERPLPEYGEDRSRDLLDGVIPPAGSYVGKSSCNEFTDRLGAGQKVLSYSYYTPGRK